MEFSRKPENPTLILHTPEEKLASVWCLSVLHYAIERQNAGINSNYGFYGGRKSVEVHTKEKIREILAPEEKPLTFTGAEVALLGTAAERFLERSNDRDRKRAFRQAFGADPNRNTLRDIPTTVEIISGGIYKYFAAHNLLRRV